MILFSKDDNGYYMNVVSFGIRKPLPAEHRQLNVQNRLTALEAKKQIIKDDLATAIETYEIIQIRKIEQRMAISKIHNNEKHLKKKKKT
jgi:hypothetical protein